MSDLLVELGLGNQQTFKSASEEPSNFTVQNWKNNESNRYMCGNFNYWFGVGIML